jgi:hypothetical protein
MLQIVSQQGVYVPYYLLVLDVALNYSCSVGYNRQETYVEYRTETVTLADGQTRTRETPYEATRTVTDWRPFSAAYSGRVTVGRYLATDAFDGLSDTIRWQKARFKKSTDFFAEGLPGYQPQPLDQRYLTGYGVFPVGYSPTDLCHRQKKSVDSAITRAITGQLPGDTYRDLRWSGSQTNESRVYLRPYWITGYRYGGESFIDIADGADINRHVGSVPTSDSQRQAHFDALRPFLMSLIPTGLTLLGLLVTGSMNSDNLASNNVSGVIVAVFAAAAAVSGVVTVFLLAKGWSKRSQLHADSQAIRDERLRKIKADLDGYFARRAAGQPGSSGP